MNDTPITSYEHLLEAAHSIAARGRRKRVVVAAAQDVDVIEAVVEADAEGFLQATLVGDRHQIESLSEQAKIDLAKVQIINESDVSKAAHAAVQLATDGKADAVMKGFLPTSLLLKTVLDKRYHLRGKPTVSHCAVLDVPGYHKFINLTDGGMVVAPDFEQKLGIMDNAIMVAQALGLKPVKVAVAGPTNIVTDKLPKMVEDAERLIPEARRRFPSALIEGPYPLDIALHRESAEHRKITSEVAGDADIYLFDSIESCNITAKSLVNFADAVFAGVIVGAKVPISLVSRTDTSRNKKASLAIACLLADYYRQHRVWEK